MCPTPICNLRVLYYEAFIEFIPIIERSSVLQKYLEHKIVYNAKESEPSFSLYEDDGQSGLSWVVIKGILISTSHTSWNDQSIWSVPKCLHFIASKFYSNPVANIYQKSQWYECLANVFTYMVFMIKL